jgi:hypothetical protein
MIYDNGASTNPIFRVARQFQGRKRTDAGKPSASVDGPRCKELKKCHTNASCLLIQGWHGKGSVALQSRLSF